MKILIVAPSRKMGGIERALSVLANEWTKLNHEVIYVSCLKSEPFYFLDKRIKVIEPNLRRSSGLINKFFFYPMLLFYLRNEFKVNKPDRILSFGDFFNPLVLIASLGLNNPVYISDRTSPDFNFPSYIKFLKNKLYPKAAGFIAQTQRAYDAKRKQFGEKFNQTIIPNAIRPIDKIDVKKEKIILYAGRFSWEKNPNALINAFAQIKDKNGWSLVMAGDGPQWDEMKSYAKSLGYENEIQFLGAVSDLDIWFNKASFFVLPSILEGFPNALCEAMMSGLPVVCFDSLPYESLLTNNHEGIVVPFQEINTLAQTLENLILDSKKREIMGINASKKAQDWTVVNVVSRYNNFMNID